MMVYKIIYNFLVDKIHDLMPLVIHKKKYKIHVDGCGNKNMKYVKHIPKKLSRYTIYSMGT